MNSQPTGIHVPAPNDIEEWRLIPTIPDFAASDFGRIRNLVSGNTTHGSLYTTGYRYIQIKKIRYGVHRLVTLAFHGLPPNPGKTQVNHLDGNKQNNCPPNLEWATPQENALHATKVLLKRVGENVNTSVLTDERVIDLRIRYGNGESPTILIAESGITASTFHKMIDGTNWSHIPIANELKARIVVMKKSNQSNKGRKRPSRKIARNVFDAILDLYEQGLKIKEICQLVKVSRPTVRKIIKLKAAYYD